MNGSQTVFPARKLLSSRVRKWASCVAAAALVAVLIGPSYQAQAVQVPQPGGGTVNTRFEIDASPAANMTVEGAATSVTSGVDWENVGSTLAATPYTTNQNHRSTGILDSFWQSDLCADTGTDPNSLKGDINSNPWVQDLNSPNSKADLCGYGAAYEMVDVNGQFHVMLYQAVTRYSGATGDLVVFQNLKGPLTGRCDDRLLAFDLTTQDDEEPENPTCPPVGTLIASDAGSNVACEPTPVKSVTSLSGNKVAQEMTAGGWVPSDGTINYGDKVRYQIQVAADGNDIQKNVVVTDKLPEGLDYTSSVCDDLSGCVATYDAASRTVTWKITSMAPGEVRLLVVDTVLPNQTPKPGKKITWNGTNVAAFASDQTPPAKTNEVPLKAEKETPPPPPPPKKPNLPDTGAGSLSPALLGMVMSTGMVLVVAKRRRKAKR